MGWDVKRNRLDFRGHNIDAISFEEIALPSDCSPLGLSA